MAEKSTDESAIKHCLCDEMTSKDAMSEEVAKREFSKLNPKFWSLAEDCKSLKRSFVCKNFVAAVKFINDAAEIAERESINHHPDLHLTQYRNVDVVIYTHHANGLTSHDFNLAHEIDMLDIGYSPKWLEDHA